MSPMRPMIGVATAAESSQAVRTQVTVLWLVCRSCWIVGSTGLTSDWSMENAAAAAASAAKVKRAAARASA